MDISKVDTDMKGMAMFAFFHRLTLNIVQMTRDIQENTNSTFLGVAIAASTRI